jgi:hypothetical protein
MADHGVIKRVDGGSFETVDNYSALLAKIKDAS